jgi:hypothetical protein
MQPPSPDKEREFKGEVVSGEGIAQEIKKLLQNKNLKIKIQKDILNIELY